jgi:single-stranded DNA-binding protein
MNLVALVGTVARAPVVRFEGESQTTRFTLAVTEHVYDPERKPYVLYVPCTSWGRAAEACALLGAEDLVAVQG